MSTKSSPAISEDELRKEHRRLRLRCTFETALATPCLRKTLEASARARLQPRVSTPRRRFDWKLAQANDLD